MISPVCLPRKEKEKSRLGESGSKMVTSAVAFYFCPCGYLFCFDAPFSGVGGNSKRSTRSPETPKSKIVLIPDSANKPVSRPAPAYPHLPTVERKPSQPAETGYSEEIKSNRSRARDEEHEEAAAIAGIAHKTFEAPMAVTGPTFSIVVKDVPLGVDLRELHRDLESKRQFGNWADDKLSKFVEGQDFEVSNNPVKNSEGRPRIDYAVSIECAKHIAMLENTERGRQVRQYFIECEKALKASHTSTTPAVVPYDPNFPDVWPPSTNGPATMSSMEIAELCDKQHAHVMRDIRTTLEKAGIGLSKFGSSYLNGQNKAQPCYRLPRLECDLVIAGYSVPYRLAIIKRWHELEAKEASHTSRMPTYPELLRALADLVEQNDAKTLRLKTQSRLLEAQAPAVKYHGELSACPSGILYSGSSGTLPHSSDNIYKDTG